MHLESCFVCIVSDTGLTIECREGIYEKEPEEFTEGIYTIAECA